MLAFLNYIFCDPVCVHVSCVMSCEFSLLFVFQYTFTSYFNSFTFQHILSVLVFRYFLQVCVCICACARCGKVLA